MGLKIIEYSDPTPPLYMHEHWVTYPRRGTDIEFYWFCLQKDWTHNFNTSLFHKVKAMLWSKIEVGKVVSVWSGVSFAEWFKSVWAYLQKVYKEPLLYSEKSFFLSIYNTRKIHIYHIWYSDKNDKNVIYTKRFLV